MEFRHEVKHEINYLDMLTLRQRLSAVCRTDPHAIDGKYEIRSLYFDTPGDTALREKLDGVNYRQKFRIRVYNRNPVPIFLERKAKISGLCRKDSAEISADEALAIVNGNLQWMQKDARPLVRELFHQMTVTQLAPKTLVDYTRYPFIYAPGNVRITMDFNLRTGLRAVNLLDFVSPTVPAGDAPILLEVKWDEYLPDIIRDIVQVGSRHAASFSKYAQCRIYG